MIIIFASAEWIEGDIETYRAGLTETDRRRPGFVTVYPPEKYTGKNRVFTSPDGQQGFALLDHGDGRVEIAGVYNLDPEKSGAGGQGVMKALGLGGNYLEAFERDPEKGSGFSLPEYYHALVGAEPKEYLPFNQEYAHPQWDYNAYGRPGLVTMMVPEEFRSDPARPKSKDRYRMLLEQLREDAMKKVKTPEKPAKEASNVVALRKYSGYMSDDPIEAYEQWERMTNLLHVVKPRAAKPK